MRIMPFLSAVSIYGLLSKLFTQLHAQLFFLFVYFGSVATFVPRGMFPFPLVMHPASGPYLPLSSCPVHISYIWSVPIPPLSILGLCVYKRVFMRLKVH